MATRQLDLFAVPAAIPGLVQAEDFVTVDEELALSARIDASALTPFQFQGWEGKRLTTSFGRGYDFARGQVTAAPPIPGWLEPLRARAAELAGLAAEDLGQALLIHYPPGAAIGWHRDRPQFETVVGVSLGEPAVLRLRRRTASGFAKVFERRAVPLPPRSAYVLAGEVRHAWEHSIVGQVGTRRSITFRSFAALL